MSLARSIHEEVAAGPLIVVLGPSGSGKDTLISYAQARFAGRQDVLFVRRAITRPADAGSEDHFAMSEAEFDEAIDRGEFALTWAANGLRYGLPRSIEAHLAQGGLAIVNGSRGAWGVIHRGFPGAVAVEISVEPAILAQRLQSRGRKFKAISRHFTPDFVAAQAFAIGVGDAAEAEGHHPRITLEWGRVKVEWWTHKIKGLHRNDFIMAAKTDDLYARQS